MNNRIVWSTKYNIGVPVVDNQHIKLVGILVRLQEEVSDGSTVCNENCVSQILAQLEEYAERHFATEEQLMKTIKYPDVENHVREHKFFTEAIFSWKEKKDSKTAYELSIFLNQWLLEHILREDQKLKNYL